MTATFRPRASAPSERLSLLLSHLAEPDRLGATSPSRSTSFTESESSIAAESPAPASPRHILLFTWFNAPTRAISSFIQGHRTLFSTDEILVLPCAWQDLLPKPFSSDSFLQRGFAEAMRAFDDAAVHAQDQSGVLVHVFSNGGCCRLSLFADYYRARRKRPLPVTALVFDSAPAMATPASKARAIVDSLRQMAAVRLLSLISLHIVLSVLHLYALLTWQTDPVARAMRISNDPTAIALSSRRAYVYSDIDTIVDWRDVEAHAGKAGLKGFGDGGRYGVKLEKWIGSKHVEHMRLDPERYWRVVSTIWKQP